MVPLESCKQAWIGRAEFCRSRSSRAGMRTPVVPRPNASSAPVPLIRLNAMLTGEMHGLPLLQFISVILLILANAFFVAAEFALVSVRDTRIEQMMAAGVPGARIWRSLKHQVDEFLPAVQFGL